MAFYADNFGSFAMMSVVGNNTLSKPKPGAESNALFNSVGRMLNTSFTYARQQFGHKIAVGSEVPLLPQEMPSFKENVTTIQDYYEGAFGRIKASYPIDQYWFWFPESWEWEEVGINGDGDGQYNCSYKGGPDYCIGPALDSMNQAVAALHAVDAPWELATSGWTLGPHGARDYLESVLPTEFVAIGTQEENDGWYGPDPAFRNPGNKGNRFAKGIKRTRFDIAWSELNSPCPPTAPQLRLS
jgi:hypothetical protein